MKVTFEAEDMTEARAMFDKLDTRSADTTAAPAAVVAETTAAPAAVVAETISDEGAPEVDSDGMPYDPELHSKERTLKSDGTWTARRGQADAANAARAAFKAGGGNVVAPVVAPTIPTLGITPVDEKPEPVSMEQLAEKFGSMAGRSVLSQEQVNDIYANANVTDTAVLNTNESLRALVYAGLCEIEPDAP